MKYVLSFAVLCLFLVSCSSVSTNYDYDNTIDFSKYKTFSFYQKGLDSLKMNDLDKSRVTNSIIANLEAKGLTMVPKGDLVVNITASNKERMSVYNRGYDPFGYGGYGRWGYGSGGTYSRQYTEGSLIIDLVDRQKNKLVWQSAATGINVDDLRRKDEMIPKTVDKMFYNYPPKK